MVVSVNTVIKITLLSLIGILLLIILWPYTPQAPKIKADDLSGKLQEIDVNDKSANLKINTPDYPAVLFGWRRPPPITRRPPTPAPKPTPIPTPPVAAWLQATKSTRVDELDITWYLFRDSRSSTVFWLCYEKYAHGWKILRELEDQYILIDKSNTRWTAFKEND